jgi:hypothetical protein
MTQPDHIGGSAPQAHRHTKARPGGGRITLRLTFNRQALGRGLSSDHLDTAAIGVMQTNHLAPAGRREILHGHAFGLGEGGQIGDAFGSQSERDESGLSLGRGVNERCGSRAPGVEDTIFRGDDGKTEILKKSAHWR